MTPVLTDSRSDAAKNERFPLGKRLTVSFNPVEDRLTVLVERMQHPAVIMLLTRRMVLLVLRQLLERLPEVSGLNKTPRELWQEVLQLEYQHALQEQAATAPGPITRAYLSKQMAILESADQANKSTANVPPDMPVYLASDLISQYDKVEQRLTVAFKGIVSGAGKSTPAEPVVAQAMGIDALYQFIQLLAEHAKHADWHLPLELPWMDPVSAVSSPATKAH